MRKQAIVFAAATLAAVSLLRVSSKAEDRYDLGVTGVAFETKHADVKTDRDQPVLRTQQFENGELQMKDVDSSRLETFLRDLNKRRDYDFSQHSNRPGPDHEYLTTWIHKTMDELFSRGYSTDKYGDLHRPGDVVSTR